MKIKKIGEIITCRYYPGEQLQVEYKYPDEHYMSFIVKEKHLNEILDFIKECRSNAD